MTSSPHSRPKKVAYADPPYPGQSARHYKDHPDYAGEVDHAVLLSNMDRTYDAWALSTSSTALPQILRTLERVLNEPEKARVAAWVKPFAAFKNQRVTMAWEPVIYKVPAGPVDRSRPFLRDWVSTMPPVFRGERSNVNGTKPQEFCFWLFDLLALQPEDDLDDLFPGSGAVTTAWDQWCRQRTLFQVPA